MLDRGERVELWARLGHIENENLVPQLLPPRGADWDEVAYFASTLDGYEAVGGTAELQQLSGQWLDAFSTKGRLPPSLTDLRVALFAEQRRDRFTDSGSDPATIRYVHALLDAVWDAVERGVVTDGAAKTDGLRPGTLQPETLQPGTLLLAPADAGERAADVLCVFDGDPDEPGAVYALLLNRPTTQLAQPLAFGLLDCGDAVAWWGGPTDEVFALAALSVVGDADDRVQPDGQPRIFVTAKTALYLPGRDHPPERTPDQVRVFSGSLWLSPDQVELYRTEAAVLTATDEMLFDDQPATLAGRLRDVS